MTHISFCFSFGYYWLIFCIKFLYFNMQNIIFKKIFENNFTIMTKNRKKISIHVNYARPHKYLHISFYRRFWCMSHLPNFNRGQVERSAFHLLSVGGGWIARAHGLISSYFALQIHPWLLRGQRVFLILVARDGVTRYAQRAQHTTHTYVGSDGREQKRLSD